MSKTADNQAVQGRNSASHLMSFGMSVLAWTPAGLLLLHYVVSAVFTARGFQISYLERASSWLYCIALFGIPLHSVILPRWRGGRIHWWPYVIFLCMFFGGWAYERAGHREVSKHDKLARRYEQQCDYIRSLHEYRWLTEKWWYRLPGWDDNAFTPRLVSVAMMACEVADFDLAKRSYERIIANEYDEYWRKRAEENLQCLKHGLKILDIYERWRRGDTSALDAVPDRLRAQHEDPELDVVYVLDAVARVFEFDLGCQAKAKEVYEKILTMDVSDISKQLARQWLADFEKKKAKARSD